MMYISGLSSGALQLIAVAGPDAIETEERNIPETNIANLSIVISSLIL
jgi:hypothetical protein